MSPRAFLLVSALALTACKSGGGGASPTATPPDSGVPEGYRGLAWGTSRDEIAKKHPDAREGKRDPSVLVREAAIAGKPATEAFFFDGDGLAEVEVRYLPKLTPAESGGLGLKMDEMFGPHEITLADEDAYQYAWIGKGTEIRLTYDLRDSVPFGPVVTYVKREPAPAETAAAAASPEASPSSTAKEPGARFAEEVRAARREGKRLLAVEASPGKLTLVLGGAGGTTEISLTADPKNGALLGSASLPRVGIESEPKERAETALDAELAKGDPVRLTFGGPAGKNMVTVVFPRDRFVSLHPGAKDPLVSSSPP